MKPSLLVALFLLPGCVSVSEKGLATFGNGEERLIERNVTWIAGAKGDRAMQNLRADWTTTNGNATISSEQSTSGITTPNTLQSIVSLVNTIANLQAQLAETNAELEKVKVEAGATREQTIQDFELPSNFWNTN